MSVLATRKLAEIAQKIGAGADPRKTLTDMIGERAIAEFEPAYDDVLIATYVRSNVTAGGIIIGGDKTRAEDRFQGKVGLVLKCGPLVDSEKFPGPFTKPIKPGDWVMYRPSDANEFFFVDRKSSLDGVSARVIQQRLLIGRIQDPEAIF